MSNFNCEKCGTVISDTEFGYITGCDHYPVDQRVVDRWMISRTMKIEQEVDLLKQVAVKSKHFSAFPLRRLSEEIVAFLEMLKEQ